MIPTPTPPAPNTKKASTTRRGVVLVAVLVVIVLLSLAGYQYSELMLAEYKVSEQAHRAAQSRAFADAGVHYAAAMLSNPDNFYGILSGNPFNNEQAFRGIPIEGDGGPNGYFSLIAPSMDGSGVVYGVMDEGGKINLNALMKLDPTGELAHGILMKLPNMTEEIVNALIDWMDADSDTRPGGAESDYYMGLNPPYRAKNGMIDSIDELLLVKGITRELLYGTDANRNGTQDENEGVNASFDRGWSAFLTVHSREQNYDVTGKAFIFLNNDDLTQLSAALADTDIGEDMAKFIIMWRQYGASKPGGQTASLGSTIAAALGLSSGKSSSRNVYVPADLSSYEVSLTKSGRKKFKSIFDLANTQVSIQSGKDKQGNTIYKVYSSPLNDANIQRDLLPKLFGVSTLKDPVNETELPPRINVNTAPPEVLTALSELSGLTDVEIEKIASLRQGEALTEPIFQTPTWLLTEAQVNIDTLRKLENLITTRTQVFRVQSVGYFEGKGPAVRVEAVIDTNSGRPRIVAWRNLTDLGKGWVPPEETKP